MDGKLRILPIGGCGEVGKNMTAIEYGDEIIIIDAGIMFPENDMLGVDLIIPDYNYVKERREKVRAVLITHGHEDHIGALPYVMADIHAPIYATTLTAGLIEVKLQRANLSERVQLNVIEAGSSFRIGSFEIEPFHVSHSIPDAVGFGITTPVGLIVHTGDYKFDHTPVDGWPPDFARLAEFCRRGVLCLLGDSTNAARPGWTPSEAVITQAFDDLFRHRTDSRIIVATFASLISRIQQVVNISAKYGRKVAVTGRSMRDNTRMAMRLGFLEIPDDMLIEPDQANRMAPGKVTILATGSQGEPRAVLSQLAHDRHRFFNIQKGDVVVLSAHAIPGNEEGIHRIINRLIQRGGDVLYEDVAEVHVSGHASQEEMKLMINLTRPKFMLPVHGELRHLTAHARMAAALGIPDRNIAVVENGTIIELTEQEMTIGPRVPGGYIFIDGAGVGDIGHSVLRDRERLAESGFLTAFIGVTRRGDLTSKPQIVSRGFTDLEKADDLREGIESTIQSIANSYGPHMGGDELAKKIEDALGRYLYDETGRRPLIEAVVE